MVRAVGVVKAAAIAVIADDDDFDGDGPRIKPPRTLKGLASRDDAWLDQLLSVAPVLNVHWAWFHVAEDEINHRGQIR